MKALQFRITQARQSLFTYGQQHRVSGTALEPESIYFTTENTNTAHTLRSTTVTVMFPDVQQICAIADTAWTALPVNVAATQPNPSASDDTRGDLYLKGTRSHKVRNQSNETINLTLYYCRVRKDWYEQTDTANAFTNMYTMMARGFSENGYDPTVLDPTNSAMIQENFTPFHSRTFCRLNKVYLTKHVKIRPGQTMTCGLKMGWKRFTPNDITVNVTGPAFFLDRSKRFNYLRGQQFIMFKLHSSLAGVTGQITLEKEITDTTPTIIMQTIDRYDFKHFKQEVTPVSQFVVRGYRNVAGAIMLDDDFKAGAEADAS